MGLKEVRATSDLVSWVSPGLAARTLTSFVMEEPKDTLETLITGFSWAEMFGCAKTRQVAGQIKGDLEPIKGALSVFNFFTNLHSLKGHAQLIGTDKPDALRKAGKKGLETINSGAEATNFCNSVSLFSLAKETIKNVDIFYWASSWLLGVIGSFEKTEELASLQDRMQGATKPNVRNLFFHKIGERQFALLRDVANIVLSTLLLISLAFASLAQGILFSPVSLLTVGTAWVLLNLICFGYGKFIEDKEKQILAGELCMNKALKA